jgi:hypothetical protein
VGVDERAVAVGIDELPIEAVEDVQPLQRELEVVVDLVRGRQVEGQVGVIAFQVLQRVVGRQGDDRLVAVRGRDAGAELVVLVVERGVVGVLGQPHEVVGGDPAGGQEVVDLRVDIGVVQQRPGVAQQARQEGEGLLVVDLEALQRAARGVQRPGDGDRGVVRIDA